MQCTGNSFFGKCNYLQCRLNVILKIIIISTVHLMSETGECKIRPIVDQNNGKFEIER